MSVHSANSFLLQSSASITVSRYVTVPPLRNPLYPAKLFHLYIQSTFTCSLCRLLFRRMTGSAVWSVSLRNTNPPPPFFCCHVTTSVQLYSRGNSIVAVVRLCKTHKWSHSLDRHCATCNERINLWQVTTQTVCNVKSVKTNINLNHIYRPSPYRAVNTLRLLQKPTSQCCTVK